MAQIRFDPTKARPYVSVEDADRMADERAEAAIRMLLDGLGVPTISDLAVVVRAGRGMLPLLRVAETLRQAGR